MKIILIILIISAAIPREPSYQISYQSNQRFISYVVIVPIYSLGWPGCPGDHFKGGGCPIQPPQKNQAKKIVCNFE